MSGPPPGYNSEASLLNGGTSATIAPVMGGGGGFGGVGGGVGGGSENISLLDGGNSAPILPVRGGGSKEEDDDGQQEGGQGDVAWTANPLKAANTAKGAFKSKKKAVSTAAPASSTPVQKTNLGNPFLSLGTASAAAPPPATSITRNSGTGVQGANALQKKIDAYSTAIEEAKKLGDQSVIEEAQQGMDDAVTELVATQAKLQENVSIQPTPEKEEELKKVNETIVEAAAPPPAAAAPPPKPALGKVTSTMETIPLPDKAANISNLINKTGQLSLKYKSRQKKLWVRAFAGSGSGSSKKEGAVLLTAERCPKAGTDVQGMLTDDLFIADRLVEFLPITTKKVIVFPAVKGDVAKFGKCLTYLQKQQPMKGKAVIFSAPFYGDNTESNKKLYTKFLSLKEGDYGRLAFVIPDHTELNFATGCQLDPAYEKGTHITTEPILNMLEPTYIIITSNKFYVEKDGESLRKTGLLFTGGVTNLLPASKEYGATKRASVSDILDSDRRLRSLAIAANPAVQDEKALGLLEVVNVRDTPSAPIPDTIRVYTIARSKVKEAMVGLAALELPERFNPAPDLNTDYENETMVTMTLGPSMYRFRNPGVAGVYEDWLQLRFTPSEAKFLNDLNLRPYILAQIFIAEKDALTGEDRPWEDVLASFLENIVESKCFTDPVLLTNRECEEGRQFMNRVFTYFLEHQDDIAGLSEDERAKLEGALLDRTKIAETVARLRGIETAELKTDKKILQTVVDLTESKDFVPDLSHTAVEDNKILINKDSSEDNVGTYPETFTYTDKQGATTGTAKVIVQEGVSFDEAFNAIKEEYEVKRATGEKFTKN